MTATPVARPFRVFALMIGAGLSLSLMVVFARFAAQTQAIVEITFFRNFVGALCLGAIISMNPRRKTLLRTVRPIDHVIRGVVGIIGLGCNFWAATLLPLADSAALFFSMPLIVTCMSVPFLGEHVDWKRWLGVVVGFIGILIIAHPDGSSGHWFGKCVALAGALFSACSVVMVRKLGTSEPEIRTVFYFFVFGALASAIFLPWIWHTPSWESLGFLVGTALAGTLGQMLQTRAYAEAPAGYLSTFNHLSIVYSTIFGWIIWNEWPTLAVFIGAGIVIGAGVMNLMFEKARTVKAEVQVEASYG